MRESTTPTVPFSRLEKIAGNVLENCLALKKKESILILLRTSRQDVHMDSGLKISHAFLKAALARGSRANFLFVESVNDPNAPQDKAFNALTSSWAMYHSVRNFKRMADKWGAKEIFSHPPDAFLIVSGKGYLGKDVVGRSTGYPIPGSKTKWNSALASLEKFKWHAQAEHDKRRPLSRTALTYAMPLPRFARSAGIDYSRLGMKTKRLFDIVKGAKTVRVEGVHPVRIKGKDYQTSIEFTVKRKWVELDDGPCKNPGDYVNIPAGEVYFTPESCNGTFIADGSIHLDNSYLIRKPLLIQVENGRYTKILTDDAVLARAVKRHFAKSREVLDHLKRSKVTSKKILNAYEENFTRIGELGIGTNWNATLSEFLIEAEKISGTVHMATGSGFSKERASVHHDDAVAGSRTPINVWADKKQIIRKSRLLV